MNFNEFLPKELVRILSGFFMLEENCRGYDPNTPIGEIANHAFHHWQRNEQKIKELEVKIKTKTYLLEFEKEEVAKLNMELDSAKMREHRINRTLWLARAKICHRLDADKYLKKHMTSCYYEKYLTYNEAWVAMCIKFADAETKCREMADKFKE